MLKTHTKIEIETQKEDFQKKLEQLVLTKIADSDAKLTRIDTEVT